MPQSHWTPEQKARESERQKARIAVELARRTAEAQQTTAASNPAPKLVQEAKPLPSQLNPKTIERWVSQFGPDLKLADKLEIAANLFVEQAVDRITDMNSRDAMIAAGISIEKMQLLRGMPTEVIQVVPILMQIGQKAAAKGFTLRQVLTAVYEQMDSR